MLILIIDQHEGDHLGLADNMLQRPTPGLNAARRKNAAFSDKAWSELACPAACVLMLGLITMLLLFG